MIPEDIVRRIRESIEIAVLVGETVKLTRRGRSLVGLCPFHKEKTPSFHVSPERNWFYCLAGETRVITWEGTRPIKELAGGTHRVLTARGKWVDAPFYNFGVQPLMRITVGRNGVYKDIFATPEHQWLIRYAAKDRLPTHQLRREHPLEFTFPRRVRRDHLSPFGIAHGIVFGDGQIDRSDCVCNLHGEKRELLSLFPLNHHFTLTRNRDCGPIDYEHVSGLPFYFKSLPSIDETGSYLMGWLAGYLATDGHVTKDGTCSINSATRENLEFVRLACTRLGIGTYGITCQMRIGIGQTEPSALYRVHLVTEDLDERFFLRRFHRERFVAAKPKQYVRRGWLVKEIADTDRVEEVFCAVVEGEHSFALEDNILTGNCFGCREHGSAIDFVMKTEGLDFREAVERLAERAGIVIADDGRKAAPGHGDPGKDLFEANSVAAAFFESQLPGSQVALAELRARGLSSDQGQAVRDALSAFRVGYAPAGWDGLVAYLQANGISPLAAEKAGLILPRKTGGGHYDRFRNRLMFAILDMRGRVVGFSGRILPDPVTGEIDKTTGKYVNSPESAIYRKGDVVFGLFQARQAIRAAGSAVLVEGNFDVLSLHARGFTNVVAPLGTAFTPMQAKLIKRICPKLVLMFDGDSAGLDATRKALPTVVDAGLEASVASLPPGWDPDAFVRDCGEDGVRDVLGETRGLIEHLVDQDLTGFGSLDVQGRVRRLRGLLDTLGSISDPAVRSTANTYVDGAVAKATDDSARTLDALRQELAAKSKKRSAQKAPEQKRVASLPRPVALSLKMLGCLIDQPDLLDDGEVQTAVSQGLDGEIALAAAQLRKLSKDGADAFIESIPEKVRRFAASRIACPRCEGLGSARALLLSCNRLLQTGNRVEENACLLRELEAAPTEDDKVVENLSRLYENMVQGQHTR